MRSLRRATLHSLRLYGSLCGASRDIFAISETVRNFVGHQSRLCIHRNSSSGGYMSGKDLHCSEFVGVKLIPGLCGYSSHAGVRSDGENDDVGHGLVEVEACATDEMDEESITEEVDSEEFLSGMNYLDDTKNKDDSKKIMAALKLLDSIAKAPRDISDVCNKWADDGNELTRGTIIMITKGLRKHRMYGKALQFSFWLEKNKQIDFTEGDYASRLSLIAKTHNIEHAEKYIEKIPESFRGELLYRILLQSCVFVLNRKKAEAVFDKISKLKLPITVDACNQMIVLYKRLDKNRVADILLIMEKENIKPSLLTYKLLIDIKGEFKDFMGMEELVEAMKADGVRADVYALTVMGKHYLSGGFRDKAESVVKEIEEMEGRDNYGVRRALLLLYASLGKAEEVGRIWKECESDPKLSECVAAMEAWGMLGEVEKAEAVFDMMLKKWKRLTSRHYSALLKVYVSNKLLAKGKELVKKMGNSGCWIGPLAWDSLVRLYTEAGEVEKADSILQKACQQNRMRPLFKTYLVVMDQYAERGDVYNTEKLFYRMREFGYGGRLKSFEVLLRAYINAKAPAYGFRERMIAENVYPNKAFAIRLALTDGFTKTTTMLDYLDL